MDMRILLAADLHGSRRAKTVIAEGAETHSADVVVLCGDITQFGPISFAKDVIEGISKKTLAIPGNCDPPEIVELLENLGVNIHCKKESFGGQTFVGFGGSNPTPFDTPFETNEEDITRMLEPLMEPGIILVSHPPPYGLCDQTFTGVHVGSEAVLNIVKKFLPRLVLTGHIHEARGVARTPTTVVNPGTASAGHLALIDVDDDMTVRLL